MRQTDFVTAGTISRDAQAVASLVPCDVPDGVPEIWAFREELHALDGNQELPDGLDMAAQASPRDGRPNRPKLEGKVEVDETYVGGPVEGTVGRGTTNPMVVSRWKRSRTATKYLGRVRMEVVEDGTQPSL